MEPAAQPWFDGPPVLNRRFVIYLPSKKKNGEPVGRLKALAAGIAGMLSKRFGGATTYPATGHFGKQREDILVIECFCGEEAWQASSAYLFSVIKALGRYCEQEAIACSLDGRMLLVAPQVPHLGLPAKDRSLLENLMAQAEEPDR